MNANVLRPITGKLKTSVSLVRTVATLKLPVSCYLVNGIYVGSCNYDDLCSFAQALSYNPQVSFVFTSLFQSFFNVDSTNVPTCPVSTSVGPQVFDEIIDVPDFSKTALNFLMSGDYNLTVTIRE